MEYFSNKHKFYSGTVYKEYPTDEQIEKFVRSCCNTDLDDPKSIFDLKYESIVTKVVELNLI